MSKSRGAQVGEMVRLISPEDLLTLGEVAELSGGYSTPVSISTVRQWIRRGVLRKGRRAADLAGAAKRCVKLDVVPRPGRLYVRRGDLEKFFKEVAAIQGYKGGGLTLVAATDPDLIDPPKYPKVRGQRKEPERRAASGQGRCGPASDVHGGPLAAQVP